MSMLVHPSHTTRPAREVRRLRQALRTAWQTAPRASGAATATSWSRTPSCRRTTTSSAGGADLRPLDDLLERACRTGSPPPRCAWSTRHAEAEQEIEWKTAPSWILIGGNKLDRGFTVEGLAITFMPRRIGAGQVDSVQQRARFFGYKRRYADLCRAWLNGTHRRRLRALRGARAAAARPAAYGSTRRGSSLKQWTAADAARPEVQAHPRAVIDIPYFHDRIRG